MLKTKFGVGLEVLEFFGEKTGKKKKKTRGKAITGRFARRLKKINTQHLHNQSAKHSQVT